MPEEAKALEEYTGEAIEFAAACRCRSLVFGCPRNRNVPAGRQAAEAEVFLRAWAGWRAAGVR